MSDPVPLPETSSVKHPHRVKRLQHGRREDSIISMPSQSVERAKKAREGRVAYLGCLALDSNWLLSQTRQCLHPTRERSDWRHRAFTRPLRTTRKMHPAGPGSASQEPHRDETTRNNQAVKYSRKKPKSVVYPKKPSPERCVALIHFGRLLRAFLPHYFSPRVLS